MQDQKAEMRLKRYRKAGVEFVGIGADEGRYHATSLSEVITGSEQQHLYQESSGLCCRPRMTHGILGKETRGL